MQDLGTSYAVKAQSQHTLVSRAFLLIILSPLEVSIILLLLHKYLYVNLVLDLDLYHINC